MKRKEQTQFAQVPYVHLHLLLWGAVASKFIKLKHVQGSIVNWATRTILQNSINKTRIMLSYLSITLICIAICLSCIMDNLVAMCNCSSVQNAKHSAAQNTSYTYTHINPPTWNALQYVCQVYVLPITMCTIYLCKMLSARQHKAPFLLSQPSASLRCIAIYSLCIMCSQIWSCAIVLFCQIAIAMQRMHAL